MLRLLLVFSLFFSTVLDACLAGDFLRSTAEAVGIESSEKCSSFENCSVSENNGHESHDQHGSHDSCQHCHSCHAWAAHGIYTKAVSRNTQRFIPYAYFIPTPFYKSLKRPPKA